MTAWLDLSPDARAREAETVLRLAIARLREPVPTAKLVDMVAEILGNHGFEVSGLDGKTALAQFISRRAKDHPNAVSVGTFQRYGRTMNRWEWSPDARKPVAQRLEIVAPAGPKDHALVTEWQSKWDSGLAPLWYDIGDTAHVAVARRFAELVQAERELQEFTIYPEED